MGRLCVVLCMDSASVVESSLRYTVYTCWQLVHLTTRLQHGCPKSTVDGTWWVIYATFQLKYLRKKVCAKLQESQKEMKVSQLQLQSYAEDLVDLIQSNLQPLTAREKKDSLLSILSSVDPCQLDYISRTSNFSVRNIAYWVQKNWLQISVDRSSVTLSFIEFRM